MYRYKENKFIIVGIILVMSAVLISAFYPLLYDIWLVYVKDSRFPVSYKVLHAYMFLAYVGGFLLIFFGPFLDDK
ncbi:MAG: hypothetical protein CVV61_03195 [Tenericutes bacterium HGW-Tenericutes-6]|nr:MAG: hypothetical protein CVV61_03195 [Tenericutes bacterium HGW-Tenericutes-6]